MLASKDIHACDLNIPYRTRYRKMIGFLRQRYADHSPEDSGDERFFRVEVTLSAGQEVRLYFLKRDLYLEGWSVLHNGVEYYLAVDKTILPQGLDDAGPDVHISIGYTEDATKAKLSAETLVTDLGSLHSYLTKLLLPGNNNRTPPWDTTQRAFHRVVRMTAEMARFGGFCKIFTITWPGEWKQSTVIGRGDESTEPSFNWAVNKWDDLSRRFRREDVVPKFMGRDVTLAEAEEIMKDGALYRR
ncbi:ribosome-inactivating family protein [Streptomyces sp. NPDC026672]|uniref:ribosome-inactivating family protein n=1 Tax=unclassified Streptomyces TaxID=2593676 RepID=UPI0033E59368